MRVAVTGSSGLLGSELVSRLLAHGHHVLRLVRRRPQADDEALWYPEVDVDRLRGVDAVVHLVGETLVGRWTPHQREAIRESRVDGTRLLADALADLRDGPRTLLCASATGYYGDQGQTELTEDSPSGTGFLASVYRETETATEPAAKAGLRVVQMRFGVLQSMAAGALPIFVPSFRAGFGFKVGSGTQWVSWIALSDAARAVVHLLGTTLSGAVNVVAPHPVTHREYANTLASVLKRPRLLTLPPRLVRILFGDGLTDEVLMASTKVLPTRLLDSGFTFEHPTLRDALERVLPRVT